MYILSLAILKMIYHETNSIKHFEEKTLNILTTISHYTVKLTNEPLLQTWGKLLTYFLYPCFCRSKLRYESSTSYF